MLSGVVCEGTGVGGFEQGRKHCGNRADDEKGKQDVAKDEEWGDAEEEKRGGRG